VAVTLREFSRQISLMDKNGMTPATLHWADAWKQSSRSCFVKSSFSTNTHKKTKHA